MWMFWMLSKCLFDYTATRTSIWLFKKKCTDSNAQMYKMRNSTNKHLNGKSRRVQEKKSFGKKMHSTTFLSPTSMLSSVRMASMPPNRKHWTSKRESHRTKKHIPHTGQKKINWEDFAFVCRTDLCTGRVGWLPFSLSNVWTAAQATAKGWPGGHDENTKSVHSRVEFESELKI